MEHPLKTWLARNEMTQTRFAEACGVTNGRISQIIQGGKPSLDLLAKITVTTNGEVTLDDFLPERGETRQ